MSNLVGKDDRLFSDQRPGPDETHFQVDNTSHAYFNLLYCKRDKDQLHQVQPPLSNPPTRLW
jgi:hypothetical protein